MKNILVENLNLKLKEGHAVCFDFDGVIHKYSKDGKTEVYMMNITKK